MRRGFVAGDQPSLAGLRWCGPGRPQGGQLWPVFGLFSPLITWLGPSRVGGVPAVELVRRTPVLGHQDALLTGIGVTC